MATRALLFDDEPTVQALGRLVAALGHEPVAAADGAGALTLLGQDCDLCLTGDPALIEAARRRQPPVSVILVARRARDAVAALRAGAADFLPWPCHPDVFAETIARVLGGEASNDGPRASDGAAVIGDHPAVRLMLERIDQAANTDANVLIRGEGGTGVEVIARLVHASSSRRSGPFVSLNLTGLPEAAIEAELFGRKLESAQRGTLFLQEVGDLPKALQAQLLGLLQERPLDVRIISATSRSLEQKVRHGAFHDELFVRLDVIPLEVPPLRARKEDIPVLAEHFRRAINGREGRAVPTFSPDVLRRLCGYDWPGNVRQLETAVERLVRAVGSRAVAADDLPTNLRTDVAELGVGILDLPPSGVDLRLLLTQLEDRLIGQALQRTGGNKNRAAELLGMNRTTLVEKLRRRNVA